jgi:molybdopterin synthase catalytic subunit
MNEVTVLFFATFIEQAGRRKARLELPEEATVADFKARLSEQFPGLVDAMGSALVAVNREYAFDEETIPTGAEVAVFPPVSGGAGDEPVTLFAITEDLLDMDAILAELTTPSTGAACFFSGMVRGLTARGRPHETSYLEYEAYQPMAESKMRQVADEMRSRWPALEGIAIVQRVGRLAPGTPTVLIACTAAHRDSGVFEAARYGIDRLKEIVPVWKKEVGPDGSAWVEGDYVPGRAD